MSPRRSAFIDIGTNTILCLIAEIRDTGRFEFLDDLAEITAAGQSVDQTGLISAEGEQSSSRGSGALSRIIAKISAWKRLSPSAPALCATRGIALKCAPASRQSLVWKFASFPAMRKPPIHFSRLSAVCRLAGRELLVVDVGGGSTEFIRGNEPGCFACREHRCRFGAADGALSAFRPGATPKSNG